MKEKQIKDTNYWLGDMVSEGMVSLLGSGTNVEFDGEMSLPQPIRKKVGTRLTKLTRNRNFKNTADLTQSVIKAIGPELIPLSGGDDLWTGTLSGNFTTERTENLHIELVSAKDKKFIKNSVLRLVVYKLPSGNLELVTYLT